MYLIVFNLTKVMNVSILNTAIEGVVGVLIYFMLLIIMKDKFLKDIINQVITTIKSRIEQKNKAEI